ncbi:hypothetical protein Esti_005398 [Eimeria stiedai]
MHRSSLLLGCCSSRPDPALALAPPETAPPSPQQQQQEYLSVLNGLLRGSVRDVHAVIVSSSRQWQNYRHMSNALSFYTLIKQQGVPDQKIILMLAGEDGPCSARNPFPAGVYRHRSRTQNLFGGHDICAARLQARQQQQQQQQQQLQLQEEEIDGESAYSRCAAGALGWEGAEVDFAGDDVTVGALVSVLGGLQGPLTPAHQRLRSSSSSTLLVFLSGHGGDEFFKFSDWEVLLQQQLAETLDLMHALRRFKNMLIIAETCQAATMLSGVRTPHVLRVSSSLKGESSYSYVGDSELGCALIDRWSHSVTNHLCMQANLQPPAAANSSSSNSNSSSSGWQRGRGVGRLRAPVSALLESLDPSFLLSTCGVEEETTPGSPSLASLPLDTFFSLRIKPMPFQAQYPGPAAPAAAAGGAKETMQLWHADALRFFPPLNAFTQQQQQQQQQEQQHAFFGMQHPHIAALLGAAVAGAACAATAAAL